MRIISRKQLVRFWTDHPRAEAPLRQWEDSVKKAAWSSFADVRSTYRTADPVGRKVVFDIGGNKYRLIAVLDYARGKLFVRAVLTHKEYDKGEWKRDTFGDDWVG